jgi:FKBP-type peptidyl-prolyl cis-trans isomerase
MKPVYSLAVALALLLASAPACAMQESDQKDEAAMADDQAADPANTMYAVGLAMAQGLAQFHLSADELKSVQEGLADGVLGSEPKVDLQEYMPKIQMLAQERAQAAATMEREAGTSYVEEAAAQEGAVKTDSGMVYQILEEGTGESPKATDQVQVHYRGTLRDGTVFDSSYDRGQPATFALNQVIPCWTEGVQQMKKGAKAKLVCPPDLAYGDRPAGSIPPGSTLTFEVELLDVVAPEAEGAMEEGMDEGAMEEGAEEMTQEPPPSGSGR